MLGFELLQVWGFKFELKVPKGYGRFKPNALYLKGRTPSPRPESVSSVSGDLGVECPGIIK